MKDGQPIERPEYREVLFRIGRMRLRFFENTTGDFHLPWLFAPGRRILDKQALSDNLEKDLAELKAAGKQDGEVRAFLIRLSSLFKEDEEDITLHLDAIEAMIHSAPKAPVEVPEEPGVQFNIEALWEGYVEDLEEAPVPAAGHAGDRSLSGPMERVLEFVLAYRLSQTVMERNRGIDTSHPQNLRHIMSYFCEYAPQFLLVYNSLTRIILGRHRFAIEERGRASRTLINSFRLEDLFIHISSDRRIATEDKSFIFSWLIAYVKVYRKIQETLYNKRELRKKLAEEWYKSRAIRKRLTDPSRKTEDQIAKYLNLFIDYVLKEVPECWQSIGKNLILTVELEDLLRMMHSVIHDYRDLVESPEFVSRIYQAFCRIIREYRDICTREMFTRPAMQNLYSSISRDSRFAEAILSQSRMKENRTPILGRRLKHEMLDETRRNLEDGNLTALFEIWPIPETSQRVFNDICRLKEMIPKDKESTINHYLHREKILEFLMRLDRVGLSVAKHPNLPVITNAYQLESFGLFTEGLYLGSTGHWRSPIRKPPSLICCTNPHAIGNCRGHQLRHIVMRVFLGTGEFYESPFVLDSTLRYGQMDEDGGIDALIMRPGLFLVEIPGTVREHWASVQEHQMKTRLSAIVAEKIRMENA